MHGATVMMIAMAAQTMANADLQAGAERFAGHAVLVDERLQLPACAQPGFAWAGPMVEARCAAPAWRVFLAPRGGAVAPEMVYVAAARSATVPPRVRRGDRVVVALAGAGFDVRLEAIADGDERDGRLWVKPIEGNGRRLAVRVQDNGQIAIDGLNSVLYGR